MIGVYQRPGKKKQVSRLQQEAARVKAGLPPEDVVVLVLPLEDVEKPVDKGDSASPVEQARARKPGRPPGQTPAKSAAQRKAKQRAVAQEPDKRNLVAAILKIYKRGMMTPDVKDKTRRGESIEDIREQNRIQLRAYYDELMLLTVRDLRKSLDALKETPDSQGRLPGENKSGGVTAPKVEQIDAAQNRDEHGHKGRPPGEAPQSYDAVDTAADAADSDSKFVPGQKPESTALVEEQIDEIVEELFTDAESPTCPWCSEKFMVPTAAENHLHAEYNKAKKQSEYVKILEAYAEDSPGAQSILKDALQKLESNEHFAGINKRVQAVRRETRLARQTLRKAKREEAERIAEARKKQDNPTVDGVPTFQTLPEDIAGTTAANERWDLRVIR